VLHPTGAAALHGMWQSVAFAAPNPLSVAVAHAKGRCTPASRSGADAGATTRRSAGAGPRFERFLCTYVVELVPARCMRATRRPHPGCSGHA